MIDVVKKREKNKLFKDIVCAPYCYLNIRDCRRAQKLQLKKKIYDTLYGNIIIYSTPVMCHDYRKHCTINSYYDKFYFLQINIKPINVNNSVYSLIYYNIIQSH